jgi:hypothetical protein
LLSRDDIRACFDWVEPAVSLPGLTGQSTVGGYWIANRTRMHPISII